MVKCNECGAELPANAKFCPSCGTQAGFKKETFQVSSEKILEKFKEVAKDATVKRVVIKDDKGKVLLSIPLVWGAAGAVATLALAPWLAALGVIAGFATKCTMEVERVAN
ncbi:MAG TPA: DUF4342 domain-containing protein [Candidatus Bathyarchaeia archaeon]|jgi:hypothetical protein|nr:DUF4342 domain-containing protein [Candidatus Bathyarchaeia archaeon]